MASKAGLGAALQSIGANLPGVASSIIGAYRTGVDRKRMAKREEQEEELMQLELQRKRQGLEAGAIDVEEMKQKQEIKMKAMEAIEKFYSALGTEEKKKNLQATVSQKIDTMSPQELRMLGGKEGAAGLFAEQAPRKTPEQIAQETGVERYQYVAPEARGITEGIRRREAQQAGAEQAMLAREQKLYDISGEREFRSAEAEKAFQRQKELGLMRTGEKKQPGVVQEGESLVYGLVPKPGIRITNDDVKQAKKEKSTYDELQYKLNKIKDITSAGIPLIGPDAELLKQASIDAMLTAKEAANLGVLNGPDLTLMKSLIGDPSSVVKKAGNTAGLLNIDKMITNLKTSSRNTFVARAGSHGFDIGEEEQTMPARSGRFTVKVIE